MRVPEWNISRYSVITFLAVTIGSGMLLVPANSDARSANAANRSASEAATAPARAPQSTKVELPAGDGKEIAEKSCSVCHQLTNLTNAHKSLDDWRDTVQRMLDNGADVPKDKLETLIQYLAKNFGPKSDAAAGDQASASPAPASTDAKPGKLPDGDGKEIAEKSCSVCHQLTNLTNAHKSLDDWRDTVQRMLDNGADVPKDKLETLIQYLAKNFGPKAAAAAPPQ